MKEKIKYGYIYITTNLINNKKYIGQHKSLKFDSNYKGSGIVLLESFKKYGKENFKCEILEWCSSLKELNEREIYWIGIYNASENSDFYNIAKGGLGHTCQAWNKGLSKHNSYIMANISNKMKDQALYNDNLKKAYKKSSSDKLKEAVRNARLGSKDSPETILKKKAVDKTNIHSEAFKELKRQRWLGKNNPNINGRTVESRLKESESMSNRVHIHKFINNSNKNKLIKKELLNQYLEDNWELGWIYNKTSW